MVEYMWVALSEFAVFLVNFELFHGLIRNRDRSGRERKNSVRTLMSRDINGSNGFKRHYIRLRTVTCVIRVRVVFVFYYTCESLETCHMSGDMTSYIF